MSDMAHRFSTSCALIPAAICLRENLYISMVAWDQQTSQLGDAGFFAVIVGMSTYTAQIK